MKRVNYIPLFSQALFEKVKKQCRIMFIQLVFLFQTITTCILCPPSSTSGFKYETCLEAVCCFDMNELEQMIRAGCKLDNDNYTFKNEVIDWIAETDNLPMLKYLISIGCKISSSTCEAAARGGQWNILRYLKSVNCPWDERVCIRAAEQNNLNVLRWAKSAGCPVGEKTLNTATLRGHFEIVRWCLSNGCCFNCKTASSAAAGRNYTILKYLVNKGCPLEKLTLCSAIMADDFSMVLYLFEKDCPFDFDKCLEASKKTGNKQLCSFILSKQN